MFEDLDLTEQEKQILELRKREREQKEALTQMTTGGAIGEALLGLAGGISGGLTGQSGAALASGMLGAKNAQIEKRLKALDESDTIKGLTEIAKNRADQAKQQRQFDQNLKIYGLKEEKQAANASKKDEAKLLDLESGIRKEYTGLQTTKDTELLADTANKLMNTPATAAGDMSLVFSFMKMLDPGSTVREGEYATAAKAAGLPDRFVTAAKKVDSGESLSPAQRVARLKSQLESQSKIDEKYKEIANAYGVPFERIKTKAGLPQRSMQQSVQKLPPVGTRVLYDGKPHVVTDKGLMEVK
jgi:hypothetical protein